MSMRGHAGAKAAFFQGLNSRFWLKRRKYAAVLALYGRSSPLKPDQASEIVGKVGEADLHRRATQADGANEQRHALFPFAALAQLRVAVLKIEQSRFAGNGSSISPVTPRASWKHRQRYSFWRRPNAENPLKTVRFQGFVVWLRGHATTFVCST